MNHHEIASRFECLGCGRIWEELPQWTPIGWQRMAGDPDGPACDECGSMYCRWLNYEEILSKGGRHC